MKYAPLSIQLRDAAISTRRARSPAGSSVLRCARRGLGVCELCYHGATPEEIAACEMPVDPEGLEPSLIEEAERTSGKRGQTLVAYALAG